ncbi:GDP/GTP exchange factor for ARF [Geranomyces variabilis]|nr:GDP/GTP exchange factor for ARF [Geranomyces variabilis]
MSTSNSVYRLGGQRIPSGQRTLDGSFAYQPSRKPRPELDWRYIVQNEIVTVTNALRKNQRWSAPFERGGRRADASTASQYDFCQENVNHGYASLDPVLEFTRGAGKDDRGVMATVEENHLLHGFAALRAKLTLLHALRDLDPLDLLDPFLQVIRSPDTTGPMTGAALTSVEKFINYRVLDPMHPGLPLATSALTDAVVRCRFEATDAVADEAVLAKILGLLRVILTSEIGQKTLHDKGICEMVEVAFGMIFQGRVNELLRKSAEQTLVALVQALFERLTVIVRAKEHEQNMRSIDASSKSRAPIPENNKDHRPEYVSRRKSVADTSLTKDTHEAPTSPSIQMFDPTTDTPRDVNVISVAGIPQSTADDVEDGGEAPHIVLSRNEHILPDGGIHTVRQEHGHSRSAASTQPALLESGEKEPAGQPVRPTAPEPIRTPTPPDAATMQPFGLPAILEMLRVLVTLIDPRNRQHTDSMHRTVALSLLHAGLEVGGKSLGVLIGWQLHGADRKAQFAMGADTAASSTTSIAEDGAPASPTASSVALPAREISRLTSASPTRGLLSDEPATTVPLDAEIDSHEDAEDRAVLMARELVLNELCKFLFRLLENSAAVTATMPSTTSTNILSLSLQCVVRLLQTCIQHLKQQQEWFLQWIIERLDSGVATWDTEDWEKRDMTKDSMQRVHGAPPQRGLPVSGEVRELILDALAQLCQMPNFAVELYINYDCDMDRRSHLYEELVTSLAKHSFPDLTPGGPLTTFSHQALCFDSLLMLLHHMVARTARSRSGPSSSANSGCSGYQTPSFDALTDAVSGVQPSAPDILRYNKMRKRILIEGCDRFNKDPKDGLKFLQENNFLPDPIDPDSLARFIKGNANLSKRVLGEYLAKPKHVDVLQALVRLMDFGKSSFDEALRMLLESFRLPGESQQIERILEVFASAYYEAMQIKGDTELENVNAVFVLAYAVILLNTDQHNKQVKHKMTLDQFKRNLRGVNSEKGDKDFSPDFLKHIYMRIREDEIVLPEEQNGDLGFDYHWKELMKRADHSSPMLRFSKSAYDKDMLLIVWNPVLAALSYAFDNAEDNLTLQKAVVGYHHCATIATYHEISDMFDNIVVSLAKMTGLLTESRQLPPECATIEEKRTRSDAFVDPWCADIGRNYRGQVAAVLLFSLVDEYGTALMKGWRWVVACVRNMFLHGLLPDDLMQANDFVRGAIIIPRVPDIASLSGNANRAPAQKREAGLFSTFANFLSISSNSAGDWTDYDATPEELSSQRKALACGAACKISLLLSDTRFLEERTLLFLIDSLMQASFAHDDRGPTQFESPKLSKNTEEESLLLETAQPSPVPIKYDASAVFLFELIIGIAIHNRDRIASVWPKILSHIQGIVSNAAPQNTILLERAIVNLFWLIIRVGHKDDMLVKLIDALGLLGALPQDLFNSIALQLMAGVTATLKSDPSLVTRIKKWDGVLALLARAATVPSASRASFEATTLLVSDGAEGSCVNAETFGECVDLLIGFAAAARVSTQAPQQQQQQQPVASMATGSASPRTRSVSSPAGVVQGSAPNSPTLRSHANQAAIDQALRALEMLFCLHYKIPDMVQEAGMKMNRAFYEFWLPVLSGLSQQAYHPSREVRQLALTHLQRALLSPQLETGCGPVSPQIWADCFENVLFPMLEELVRPEMTRLDPAAMDETRMRAAALLCKVFLQYFGRVAELPELGALWGRILEFMRRYMTAGGPEYLREAVIESLKNMLLVMSTQGIFQPPSQEHGRHYVEPNLWGPTWDYIDSFHPELRAELFPPVSAAQPALLDNNRDPQLPSPQLTETLAQPGELVDPGTHVPNSPHRQQQHRTASGSWALHPPPVTEVDVEDGTIILQDEM